MAAAVGSWITLHTSRPARVAANRVALRCDWSNSAGTLITALLTSLPRHEMAVCLRYVRM